MTAPVNKKKLSTGKLLGALAFLGFSIWLSLGPWIEEILGPLPFTRTEPQEQEHAYGGFESARDLLRLHASFDGDPRQVQDPFRWIAVEPDPGPGGIATIEVVQETRTSTEIEQGPDKEPGGEEQEEIPQLDVRLILRTPEKSRVLVDGQILGMGDMTRAGPIVDILDTGIHTLCRGKKLFFALSPR